MVGYMMLEIELEPHEKFVKGMTKYLEKGKKYQVSTEVEGIEGIPFSGFFGVLIVDKNNNVVDRKIRWLNDFSSTKKNTSSNFQSTYK